MIVCHSGACWEDLGLCTAVGSKLKLPGNEMGSQWFVVLASYLVLLMDFGFFFSVGNSVYELY